MKIIAFGDLHVCDDGLLRDRQGDLVTVEMPKIVKSERPDVVLITGDLSGRSVPHRATPVERATVVLGLARMARFAPVVVVRGNHDLIDDWGFLNLIRAKHPIRYVEHEPEIVQVGDLTVVAAPWMDRSAVSGDYAEAVAERISWVIEAAQSPAILLGHFLTSVSRMPSGFDLIQRINPETEPVLPVRPDVFSREKFVVAIMGHLHAATLCDAQDRECCHILHTGSSTCQAFGEPIKSYLIIQDPPVGKIRLHDPFGRRYREGEISWIAESRPLQNTRPRYRVRLRHDPSVPPPEVWSDAPWWPEPPCDDLIGSERRAGFLKEAFADFRFSVSFESKEPPTPEAFARSSVRVRDWEAQIREAAAGNNAAIQFEVESPLAAPVTREGASEIAVDPSIPGKVQTYLRQKPARQRLAELSGISSKEARPVVLAELESILEELDARAADPS